MRDVCVIGIGQTPIGELWEMSLRDLAYQALHNSIEDAGIEKPDALFVGNMMAARLSDQAQLAYYFVKQTNHFSIVIHRKNGVRSSRFLIHPGHAAKIRFENHGFQKRQNVPIVHNQ